MFDCPLIPDNFLGFEFVIEIEMPVIQEFWYPAKIFRLVYRVCTITATAPGAKLAHGAVLCAVLCVLWAAPRVGHMEVGRRELGWSWESQSRNS